VGAEQSRSAGPGEGGGPAVRPGSTRRADRRGGDPDLSRSDAHSVPHAAGPGVLLRGQCRGPAGAQPGGRQRYKIHNIYIYT